MYRNNLLKVALLVDKAVVDETLSRMGIGSLSDKKLYQSCYLLRMWGDYYLAHFKQLFQFTQRNGVRGYGDVSKEDMDRRDSIAYCLKQWHLVDFPADQIDGHETRIFVLPYSQKKDWTIVQKLDIRNIELLDEHF